MRAGVQCGSRRVGHGRIADRHQRAEAVLKVQRLARVAEQLLKDALCLVQLVRRIFTQTVQNKQYRKISKDT